MTQKTMDIGEFIEELAAGTFGAKISRALQTCALQVVEHDKSGEVTIKFKLKKAGESSQVMCEHQIKTSRPTLRGKQAEEDTTSTPLFVNPLGILTLMPLAQGRLFEKEEQGK